MFHIRISSSTKLCLLVFMTFVHVVIALGASGTQKQYIIYPGTPTQNKKYKFDLQTLVGPNNVQEYGTPFTGVLFWLVNLDASQVIDFATGNKQAVVHINKAIVERKNVSVLNSVNYTSGDLFLPNATYRTEEGIAYQQDPPDDLKVVSWPPSKRFKDLNYFAYDRSGGKDVVLFLMEEGINLQHSEFAFTPTAWRYAPMVRATKTDDDPISHGSCVASKAVGTHYGLSKGSPVYVMKSSIEESDVLWAFGNIADQMYQNGGSQRKSVILFAFGSKTAYNPSGQFILPQPWLRIRELMQAIIDLDGIIVVPSGNSRDGAVRENSDILPALFTRTALGRLPLTLVGSCDSNGILAPFSQQSSYIKAWAPGIDVKCAKSDGVDRDSGTSVSAGMVAGLATYFLGFSIPPFPTGGGQTARNFNQFLKTSASWRRSNIGVPNMLYNLQDGSKNFPLFNSTRSSLTPDIADT